MNLISLSVTRATTEDPASVGNAASETYQQHRISIAEGDV